MAISVIKILEPDQQLIRDLIDLERKAFGDGGLHNEWLIVPMIRHGRVYGLFKENQLVGSAQMMSDWSDPSLVYFYGLNIDPEYRGQGLGSIFLSAVLEELTKEGWRKVELTVDPHNNPAIRLYKGKYSFKDKKLIRDEYGPGEHRLVMELNLVG